jgi:L-methionine (R)-S-oxide reductase
VRDRGKPFAQLLIRVKGIVDGQGRRDDKLMAICQLLTDDVSHYDWVGFYLVDEGEKNLLLGPYVGQPTRHVKIPFGQGVCGLAAEEKRTIMVPDVSQVLNYLSCSPQVRSEMVVPIFKDGQMVGELDIDSHTAASFAEEDKTFLEGVCREAEKLF